MSADQGPAPLRQPDLLPNNFDLLRLAAAAQVMIVHLNDNFLHHESLVIRLLRQAPGVPIFFFISGYLISASWERHPDLAAFARNRVLRIVPAYVAVTLFSLAGILLFAHLNLARDSGRLVLWFVAQFAFLSDWNPQFLRSYGTGVVNASLWTIPVEICFYVATPLLYLCLRRTRRTALFLGSVAAICFTVAYADLAFGTRLGRMVAEGISLTPVPWFGMFVFGILAQRNRERLLPLLRRRAAILGMLCLALMILSAFWIWPPLIFSGSRFIGIANFTVLALFLLAAAYARPTLAIRLLRRNDISYGLYLVHLPVANMLLANGVTGFGGAFWAGALSVPLALLSWFVVEKPALGRRRYALYPHGG